MRKKNSLTRLVLLGMAILALFLVSCRRSQSASEKIRSVAVFVPGAVAGSPIYEQMALATKKAVDEAGLKLGIIEAGFNQAEWQNKLTELAATGEWDLIVTSNPSMPALAAQTVKAVPAQRFFIADGYLKGNSRIATVQYNQVEQGYVAGYLAGLITTSELPGANAERRVGLVLAQRYPSLDQAIIPGFRKGLEAAAPGAILDERVVGNWYDNQKGMELAKAMFDQGVDVILPIAGGAGQGVLTAAQAGGKYIVWFDSSAYGLAKGTILGCSVLRQERVVYEGVKAAIEGSLEYGNPRLLGMKEGYVDFDDADPLWKEVVPAGIRGALEALIADMRSGALALESPTF